MTRTDASTSARELVSESQWVSQNVLSRYPKGATLRRIARLEFTAEFAGVRDSQPWSDLSKSLRAAWFFLFFFFFFLGLFFFAWT